MEIIKNKDTFNKVSSSKCQVTEYPFKKDNLDLGIANISGRYPDSGYCLNEKSDELVYILEGNGKIVFENKEVLVNAKDALIINAGELYYWNTDKYLKAAMICNPSFKVEQYKNINMED